jgi:hypothetical protein
MALRWTTRPSSLLAIRDEYVAFCIDEAVHEFGYADESELAKIEGKNPTMTAAMRERTLHRLLEVEEGTGAYADPNRLGLVKREDV